MKKQVEKNVRFLCVLPWKNKYKEKYTSNMKGHYEGIDKKTMHAMKARKLASDVRIFLQLQLRLAGVGFFIF